MLTVFLLNSDMARKRPVQPGTRQYGTKTRYSADMLAKIIEDVTAGRIGQREAARVYGVPRQTIVNKMKNRHTRKVGRPIIFSPEEENVFVRHCIAVSDMGIPISLFDLRLIVKSYLDSAKRKVGCFPGNMPGWEWGKSFIERHKSEIGERFATNISRKRALVNEETIKNFFEQFEMETVNVLPENIYNYDESGFHDTPSKGKVLIHRSCRHPEKILNTSKSCYTVMFCGNAVGEFIPPYIIFKGKQKWTDWLYNAPHGTKLNSSESGWMDQTVFDDWFEFHFLPVAIRKEGKKILIGDNLSSHISIKTLNLCKENNISFICLPPNSTHLLQPLDVAYFSSLKTNWRQVLADWRKTPEGKKKVCLPKGVFSELLAKALLRGQSTASSNLAKGFEKSGLYPVDCNRVLEALPGYAKPVSLITESVGIEFKKYLEDIRESDLTVRKVKKYRLPVEPGRSISVEEVKEYYNNKESGNTRGQKRTLEVNSSSEQLDRNCTEISENASRPISGARTRGGRRCNARLGVRTIVPTPKENNDEESAPIQQLLAEIVVNNCDVPETSEPALLIADRDTDICESPLEYMSKVPNVDFITNQLAKPTYEYNVEDFVIISYQGAQYPGKVITVERQDQVNTTLYEISCMTRKGKTWVWPEKIDAIWYQEEDIIKKLDESCVKLVNKRGMMRVNDPILYSDDDDE